MRPNALDRVLHRVVAAVLGLLLLVQVTVAWRSYLGPLGAHVYRLRELPAWERTAILLEGDRFARMVGFLRAEVPEDAVLVLPPHRLGSPIEDVSFMQYFLFPREIRNCGREAPSVCLERSAGPTTYLLAASGFPPPELAARTKHFVPFEDENGVYAPGPR